MPYTIDYLEDEQIVFVKNTGELSYEDLAEQGREALELARMKDTGLFLADSSGLTLRINTLEILDLPSLYEKLGSSRTNKLALLLSEDAATNEEIRFYETACRNRGWQIRVFSSRDTAVDWLLG